MIGITGMCTGLRNGPEGVLSVAVSAVGQVGHPDLGNSVQGFKLCPGSRHELRVLTARFSILTFQFPGYVAVSSSASPSERASSELRTGQALTSPW